MLPIPCGSHRRTNAGGAGPHKMAGAPIDPSVSHQAPDMASHRRSDGKPREPFGTRSDSRASPIAWACRTGHRRGWQSRQAQGWVEGERPPDAQSGFTAFQPSFLQPVQQGNGKMSSFVLFLFQSEGAHHPGCAVVPTASSILRDLRFQGRTRRPGTRNVAVHALTKNDKSQSVRGRPSEGFHSRKGCCSLSPEDEQKGPFVTMQKSVTEVSLYRDFCNSGRSQPFSQCRTAPGTIGKTSRRRFG